MNKKVLFIFLFIIVLIIGVVIYLQATQPLSNVNPPSPTIAVSATNTPSQAVLSTTPTPSSPGENATEDQLTVTVPQPNAQVASPLTVLGSVPPGWMFEGVFAVKLLDGQKNVIAQGQGKEIKPGSWNTGNNVPFRATLEFKTAAKKGFVVLEKDNPSGLPENAGSFEIPVTF